MQKLRRIRFGLCHLSPMSQKVLAAHYAARRVPSPLIRHFVTGKVIRSSSAFYISEYLAIATICVYSSLECSRSEAST
jgi:hypothetical protein